ncbi:hypothetical protein DV737_g2462, partial [Chaetothyriales sp. CBS 132003]
MRLPSFLSLLSLLLLPALASAQFQFFDNFFQQQQQGGQQRQSSSQQNVPSDSAWYQQTYDSARCSNYLCPDTLACVHFPHHCPCAWPSVQDKVELGEGVRLCASKGGWKNAEVAAKVDLARKGWI